MEDGKRSGLELPGKEGEHGVTSFKQGVCQWAMIMVTLVLRFRQMTSDGSCTFCCRNSIPLD